MPITTSRLRPEWLAIALCPAIAVSDWTVHALGLALSAFIASIIALVCRVALRKLPPDARWPINLMILVALHSCVSLAINAWWHALFAPLNVFVLLFAANLAVHSESAQVAAPASFTQGMRASFTIAIALLLLGLARELVGHGSILHGAGQSLAGWMNALAVPFFRADRGFLLAMLAPGAFIATGFLIAARNWLELRAHESQKD
ncbi:MAG: Rnf-Nqr domain containing protein [Povalibacter sp.]